MSNKEDYEDDYENENEYEEIENDEYYDDDNGDNINEGYIEDEDEDEDEEYEEEIEDNNMIGGDGEEDSINNDNNNYMDEEEDDEDENYLQKLDRDLNKNIILDYHPECKSYNYNEIETLSVVVRDKDGIIIDELHKTIPILTKYEYSKVLGLRALQINSGSKPYIKVQNNIVDGYLIAKMELEAKLIPYIIKRPVGNGFEIWKISDLEILDR